MIIVAQIVKQEELRLHNVIVHKVNTILIMKFHVEVISLKIFHFILFKFVV